MGADFPCLYRYSLEEARRYGETRLYEESFRQNVSCALAIEQAIRGYFNEADESLAEGCAQSVLERYGFKRVNFVLTNTIQEMDCPHLLSEESRQWGRETFVPPDDLYNRYFVVDTAAPLLDAFTVQVRQAYQALRLFGPEHCEEGCADLDFTGKVLVLSPDALRESCWSASNMLWLAEGGFGCSPSARGRAVYAACLGDGEQTRWNREDFTGVLKEKFLPDWALARLEELRRQEQRQINGPAMGGIE